jgi:NADPH2:quinone reductase
MMADGSHYDSLRQLPAVVGLDGVGMLEDGTRVYCGGSRPPYGTMAERTVVPRAFCLPVPDAVDDLTAAALPNPALSSWLALAGRAGRVVGAGRDAEALAALAGLGADATIRLQGRRPSWRRRSPARPAAATTWSSTTSGAARPRRWSPPSLATT